MAPIYKALREKLNQDGMLVAFSDDVYLHGPPVNVAAVVYAAPSLYKKVGLRIGWGLAKSELALPPNVDPETLSLPRGDDGRVTSARTLGAGPRGVLRHPTPPSDVHGLHQQGHAEADCTTRPPLEPGQGYREGCPAHGPTSTTNVWGEPLWACHFFRPTGDCPTVRGVPRCSSGLLPIGNLGV